MGQFNGCVFQGFFYLVPANAEKQIQDHNNEYESGKNALEKVSDNDCNLTTCINKIE